MPIINENDIVVIGSFFALNPILHERLVEILEFAQTRKAIIYYDVNFRKTHINEVRHLMPSIIDNYEFANIIKGSDEDFHNIYNEDSCEQTYNEHIKFYCRNFIYTQGEKGVTIYSENFNKKYQGKKIKQIRIVGAGDSLNAAIIFGLLKENIKINNLKEEIPKKKGAKFQENQKKF